MEMSLHLCHLSNQTQSYAASGQKLMQNRGETSRDQPYDAVKIMLI